MNEEKKDEKNCCQTKSCCGGTKLLIGVLLGVLIFGAGFWFAKANCPGGMKMCPINQYPTMMQK